MQRDLLRVLRQLDASETKIDPDRTAVIFPQIPRARSAGAHDEARAGSRGARA